MANYEEAVQGPVFNDRKAGLIVFGIIQVIFGGLCALMVPFAIFGMIVSRLSGQTPGAPISVRMMIPAILFYVILAVWFISMGIGSIKARRWARALILVSSWLWLIGGTVGLIFMLLLMPNIYDRMGEEGQLPRAVILIMKSVMIGFMTVVYVIIPAVFVLFYSSKNVKATCQFRDSQVRWTDRCPLPVLAVSLIFGFWAVSMLSIGFYRWTIPFFGSVLSGLTGALVALIILLLAGYVAWGSYKLDIKAWWCAVFLILLWILSAAITFSRVSIWDFYEKMSFPQQHLDIIKEHGLPQASTMGLFFGLSAIGFLGYLLYTKRYFAHPPERENIS